MCFRVLVGQVQGHQGAGRHSPACRVKTVATHNYRNFSLYRRGRIAAGQQDQQSNCKNEAELPIHGLPGMLCHPKIIIVFGCLGLQINLIVVLENA